MASAVVMRSILKGRGWKFNGEKVTSMVDNPVSNDLVASAILPDLRPGFSKGWEPVVFELELARWDRSGNTAILTNEDISQLELRGSGEFAYAEQVVPLSGDEILQVTVQAKGEVAEIEPAGIFPAASLKAEFLDENGQILGAYSLGTWREGVGLQSIAGTCSVPADSTAVRIAAEAGGGLVIMRIQEVEISGTRGERSLGPDTPALAESLHREAWSEVAQRAALNLDYKCGLYASCTLAVKHPEVYPQADRLFNKILRQRGSEAYYLYMPERNQNRLEQDQVYERYAERPGRAFSWRRFRIERYSAISQRELYGDVPFFPFIDLRLHVMAASLKGFGWQATPISMAEFLYFKYGQERGYRAPFLLVTEQGGAYVSLRRRSERVLMRHDGFEVEEPEGKVILVMDDSYVWYPLMARDDRKRSSSLAEVVEMYASEGAVPDLTAFEEHILPQLRQASELSSSLEESWVLHAAAKLHFDTWNLYPSLYRRLYPQDARRAGFSHTDGPWILLARNALIARISSRLSPTAAKWAAAGKVHESDPGQALYHISQGFIEQEPMNSPGTVGCQLWSNAEYIMFNLDDYVLANASMCLLSAASAAAVLDVAELSRVDYWITLIPGHAYTTVFFGDIAGVVENGHWRAGSAYGLLPRRPADKYLKGAITEDGWVIFTDSKAFGHQGIRASLDPEEVIELLQRIDRYSHSEAVICTYNEPDEEEGVLIQDFLERAYEQYGIEK